MTGKMIDLSPYTSSLLSLPAQIGGVGKDEQTLVQHNELPQLKYDIDLGKPKELVYVDVEGEGVDKVEDGYLLDSLVSLRQAYRPGRAC